MQTLGETSVLEWGGWARAVLRVPAPGGVVKLHCTGVASAEVRLQGGNGTIPLAGDVYGAGWLAPQAALPGGEHRLWVRLRAKARARFACTAAAAPAAAGLELRAVLAAPDVVGGAPLGGLLSLAVAHVGGGGGAFGVGCVWARRNNVPKHRAIKHPQLLTPISLHTRATP